MKKLILLASLAASASSAWSIPLQCTEDQRTNAMQCVAPSEVRISKESIRYAPLYTGGPNQMKKTNFSVHTNCATGVTHLKDRAGVSFSGGDGNETRAIRELRGIICAATIKGAKSAK